MGPGREKSGGISEGSCRHCINITKWMPVLFIVTVIAWSYYAFVIQVCLITMQETWLKILALIVYHIVTTLFLWSYWQTIFTCSSRVPRKFKIPQAELELMEGATQDSEIFEVLNRIVRSNELPVQTRTNLTQLRYCEKCQIIKPDRTHHCSVCGYCILKMDHHCPLVSLFGYHCFLVTKNRSTLESFRSPVFSHGPDKKGFNLGCYNNFVEVFGDDKKKWFLPVFTSLGDGISFPTRHIVNTSNNGNYNSLDTTDSSAASGNSPDHCVEVKVEARTELRDSNANPHGPSVHDTRPHKESTLR
ncbi:unnamed protein product [Allacma fusca]|uniref:Palmitoyltransferase n=1 Tax=Allacma fusca TaxID=39272 RepID=A0A8J2KR00_9HEXA|nr:unnamed protein product [Allacma fusca]